MKGWINILILLYMHVVVYHDHYRKGWKWWVSLLYIGIISSILGTFWYILLAGDWRAASFLQNQFSWLNHHEQKEWFKLKLKLSWNGWHRCVGHENEGTVSVWRHHIFIRYEIVIVSKFPQWDRPIPFCRTEWTCDVVAPYGKFFKIENQNVQHALSGHDWWCVYSRCTTNIMLMSHSQFTILNFTLRHR